MGLLDSFRRHRKIKRLSKILGRPFNSAEFINSIKTKDGSKKNIALEGLLDFCESNAELRRVIDSHSANRETLLKIYKTLIANGAGQWEGGAYVPVAALTQPWTLRFLFENCDKLHWGTVCILLLEYFERNESGPVPQEVRGPDKPYDPLYNLWELEQKQKDEDY